MSKPLSVMCVWCVEEVPSRVEHDPGSCCWGWEAALRILAAGVGC